MNSETRQTIYMGISFIVTPMPVVDRQSFVGFQGALLSGGIEFTQAAFPVERQIVITRGGISPLNITITTNPPASGQLLIIAPQPGSDLSVFTKEAEAVVAAFDATWPAQSRQVLHSDATFRDVFEASDEHAFKELWEKRLHQTPQSLSILQGPVLGGGLRLVMPAQQREGDRYPTQIEIKIESFLQDSHKFIIETQFTWPQPVAPGEPIDPGARLAQLDRFIEKTVIPFARGDL